MAFHQTVNLRTSTPAGRFGDDATRRKVEAEHSAIRVKLAPGTFVVAPRHKVRLADGTVIAAGAPITEGQLGGFRDADGVVPPYQMMRRLVRDWTVISADEG